MIKISKINSKQFVAFQDYTIQFQIVIPDNVRDSQVSTVIKTSEKEKYIDILAMLSDSDYNSKIWFVKDSFKHTPQKVSFNNFVFSDKNNEDLIKCWTISMLADKTRAATMNKYLCKLAYFFEFLRSCRTSIFYVTHIKVDSFIDDIEIKNNDKNDFVNAINSLREFALKENILLKFKRLNSFKNNAKDNRRTAVEESVLNRLDKLFFDLNTDIPIDYRAIYLLMRFIPNRISEVLNMDLNCITIPDIKDVNVFTISIPTAKTTRAHIPKYRTYSRKLDGKYECILYQSLQSQKIYAEQHQDKLHLYDKGYLFVSSKAPIRLTSAADFNDFLDDICINNKILDSSGKIAHVTSHMLRHSAISAMRRTGILTDYQIAESANHENLNSLYGYSRKAEIDETHDFTRIVTSVFNSVYVSVESVANNDSSFNQLPEYVYKKNLQAPQTRIVPGYGICTNISCTPKYETCFSCEFFEPNEIFYEYFVEANALIDTRLKELKKNPVKNASSIIFNEKMKHVNELFIHKVDEMHIIEDLIS